MAEHGTSEMEVYAWSPSSMVQRGSCTDYAALAEGGEYVPLAEYERLRERIALWDANEGDHPAVRLYAENERLREALAWYASATWMAFANDDDTGRRAREALRGADEGKV